MVFEQEVFPETKAKRILDFKVSMSGRQLGLGCSISYHAMGCCLCICFLCSHACKIFNLSNKLAHLCPSLQCIGCIEEAALLI